MKKLKITGIVHYQDLGPGFWGIVGDNGQNWRPVNMPEQLKKEGFKVRITAKEIEEGGSLFMWGTPVKITAFHT